MRVRWFAPLIIAAALVGGCSSSSSPSSSSNPAATGGATTPPPISASSAGDVCATWKDLTASVAALQKVNVLTGGTNAIQAAVQDIQAKFNAFQTAAATEFAPQLLQMRGALSSLESAVQAMVASPGTTTIGPVALAVTGFVTAYNSLQTVVKSRCG